MQAGDPKHQALYTQLVSKGLFPLHERLKSHQTVALRRSLERSQWLSPALLATQQRERLQKFLLGVYRNTPYYTKLFRSLGIDEVQLEDEHVLQRIPCLSKDTIRANQADLLTTGLPTPQFMSTSGSSGQPLRFAVGKERISHDIAAKWRATRWWGVDIGDPEAVVWGSDIELSGQGLAKQARDRLMRSKLFPAKHLRDQELLALYQRLQQYQPAMIYGYPSILTLLAETAKAHNLDLSFERLGVIFCTAEKLYDHQRQLIEAVFKAPVANGYGSRDAGFIAHECPQGNLHISAEDIIVEILDDQQQPVPLDEQGEIVITHMATQAFPMIRYRTGDIGRLSDQPCSCKRGLPVLAEVIGRANDLLRATDGASIHGAFIGNIIREDNAINQFQFIQHKPRLFELKVTCHQGTSAAATALKAKLKHVLGQEAQIEINIVTSIGAEKTGKFKYIVNRCNDNQPAR